MSSLSQLFQHFIELINLKYYTKQESDEKYLVKDDFDLIIDNEGILRIVTSDDDNNSIYTGGLYALKSDVHSIIEEYGFISKDDLTEVSVIDSEGNNRKFLVYEELSDNE